ncbi:deaminase [Actinoplanes sp. NPDC049265]|uniref:deaminase n=1 Tax=Actinoplanes sp. NPDC049265 TaxID=3363902 RepID=UPI0037138C4E
MVQSEYDRHWLTAAIDLSRLSPPSPARYAVGAVIVGADGTLLASGYTAEGDDHIHAEEAALAKLSAVEEGATIYSSLEPCTMRRSRPFPCTDLILNAGLRRVVFALREPEIFADCTGLETLRANGVEVVELATLGAGVVAVNAHLLNRNCDDRAALVD